MAAIRGHYGVADLPSVEEVVRQLHEWRIPSWITRVEQLRGWSRELFDWLEGRPRPQLTVAESGAQRTPVDLVEGYAGQRSTETPVVVLEPRNVTA